MNTQNNVIIRRMFFASLGTMIFSSISMMLGSLVDGIIRSRFLGEGAMASFSVISPIYNINMMLAGILSSGAQVAYSKVIGKGEADRARAVFNICFFVALGLSLILGIFTFFGSDLIGEMFGATGKNAVLLPGASSYLRGLALGFPAVLMVPIVSGFMQIDGDRKRTIIAMSTLTVTDIIADLMNVFVFHGGMFGMAFATSVASYVALLILLLHFLKKNIMLKLSLRGLKGSDLLDIIKNGLPNAISNGGLMVQKLGLNYLLLGIAGAYAVSALGKSYTFYGFVNTVVVGVGGTTMLVAGVYAGEEDREGLRYLQKLSLRFGAIASVILCAIIAVFAPFFVRIFMEDTTGEAYSAAVDLFRINAFGLPFLTASIILYMYLQGIRNALLSRLFSFLERVVCILVPAVILGFLFGVRGVWIALPLGEALTLFCILLAACIRRKKAASFQDALLFLPEDFGPKPEDVLSFSMESMPEVMSAADQSREFITEHGGDDRKFMLLPLCIEELAGNIARFGFADGKKHRIEVKVIYKNGDWIVRIKDDCAAFDQVKWLEAYRPDDPEINIGIRTICGMAKEVRYVSTMQMNVLIINV